MDSRNDDLYADLLKDLEDIQGLMDGERMLTPYASDIMLAPTYVITRKPNGKFDSFPNEKETLS